MSVEKIKENKYKITITLGYDVRGKKIRKTQVFHGGLKQAREKEYELKIAWKDGTSVFKESLLFQDLANEYLKFQKNKITEKTYITYEQRIIVINEVIGKVKLKNLNTKILENLYYYLKNEYISVRKKKISNTTLQHYYNLVNNILEQAVKWDYIKKNPNNKIEKPKRERNVIAVYDKEEVIKLLECLKTEPLKNRAIIYLTLDSGCRLGEITALTWNDIDLETGAVIINKTTQVIKGKIIEKATKSINSDRKIFVSETTTQILKQYKKSQQERKLKLGTKWGNSNRIFTTEFGNDIHHDTPSKIFEKIIKKYGLKRITFHGLRHTNASLKIREGIQPQIISRSLGHSSVQITDKFYSHFFEEEFKDMSNIMEKSIFVKVN